MKIVSWNVNGLRSTEKSCIQFIKKHKPDMLMIQELRAHPDQLSIFLKSIRQYVPVFNPAERAGYSGTALYYRENLPLQFPSNTSIHKDYFYDNAVLTEEGRTIYAELGNYSIINFYTPNGTSGDIRQKYKYRFFNEITKFCKKLLKQKRSVIIGGDLNVGHTNKDVFDSESKVNHSGFLKQERDWFSNLLVIGFVDTFRMFEREGGHYTWWHMRDPKRRKNRGWRFDYFLVSKDIRNNVKKSVILKNVFGSDHCPIELDIEITS